ncbi:hypothetical protein, partial [Rhodococcus zopfii]|uniref:hypothetical protein n=1 Tax=Rhodococcus zopfii TaxID=43772 RepID=UPI001EDFFD1C
SFSLWCRCRIRAQSSIEITHPIVVGWPGFHPSFLDWFSTAVDTGAAIRLRGLRFSWAPLPHTAAGSL